MKGTDRFTQHIIFQSDWQDGGLRPPGYNKQLSSGFSLPDATAQNKTPSGAAPFTSCSVICSSLPPPVDLLLTEPTQDNAAQRRASEQNQTHTFSGLLWEVMQIPRATKQLCLSLGALGAAGTSKEEFINWLCTQGMCKYLLCKTASCNYRSSALSG